MTFNRGWVAKSLLIAMLAAVLVMPLTPVTITPISAAPDITLTSSVTQSFPDSMTFKVSARSTAVITQLRLHYIVQRQSFGKVVSEGWALFNPAASVDTQWVWDMRKSSLPGGARVEYWWSAKDAGGGSIDGPHATVAFEDNRHAWQSITRAPVTILWYQGDANFANSLMDAAQAGLSRIENDTGAMPTGSVKIYIYASTQDLQSAHLFAPSWEGGVTFGGFGIIAIGVPTNQLAYGQRTVPHELTHWIVGQRTFNNYGADLPTWLSEGLATYGEGTLSPDYKSALDFAIANNKLFTVRSLSSPFSAVPLEAYISYAQSDSIVTFFIQKYGKTKMVQLLDRFKAGSGYDDALKAVYGFDQDGLDAQWRQSLGIKTTSSQTVARLAWPEGALN